MKFNKQTTDYFKMMAIILVISGHYLHLIGMDNTYTMNSGAIGVGMFLFVSGYGLEASMKKTNGQVVFSDLMRILSLIFVYELATITKLIINMIMNLGNGVNFRELIGLGFRSELDPTMWYMFFIIFMYCAFYFINYFINNMLIKWLGLLAFGIALAGLSHYLSASFSFLLGVIAYDLRNNEYIFNIIAIITAVIGSTILFGFVNIPINFVISPSVIKMTILVVFIPLCFAAVVNSIITRYEIKWPNKFAMEVARISFALYLFEGFGFTNQIMADKIVHYQAGGLLIYMCGLLGVAYLFTNLVIKPLNYRNLTGKISGSSRRIS